MRIAYLNMDTGIPVFGNKGASNHVREFAVALRNAGHEVSLFASNLGGQIGEFPCTVRVPPGPGSCQGIPAELAAESSALTRSDSLRSLLEQEHETRPFDLVYERYSLWNYGGLGFAQSEGLPFVLEVNSPLRLEQKAYRKLRLEAVARSIERTLYRSATLVVGVSDAILDFVRRESGRRLPSLKLPNGVDLQLFEQLPEKPPGGPLTVGFVGSLKPWHGIEVLMEAFARILGTAGDCTLLIVGEGPMRTWIEAFVAKHNLGGNVRFTGAVEKCRVPEMLARMDVAVAPYPPLEDFYFSPLKIFEYMAAGRAIVASAIGQISEILTDRETALLVRPGDGLQLAEKILQLRSDEFLRRRIGEAARREAFHRHGWKHRVESLWEVLPPNVGGPRPTRVESMRAPVYAN